MACFDLPIHKNPLRTRKDVERALLQLLEPVRGRFTAGNAGLKLGAHAAHYGEGSARMEGFSRMLWGLAPLWAAGGGAEWLPLFREGLVNGTDPDHPAYWGRPFDYDQKVVEMAAISTTLLLCGERMNFTPQEAEHLHRWLAGAEGLELPQNNWLFFQVLAETAFRRMGWDWNAPRCYKIAVSHARTAQRYIVRPDGSCNHIAAFDPDTGEYLNSPGGQGYEQGSSWSRGQS